MMRLRNTRRSRRSRYSRGFSQIEVVASTAMLGIVMTATMTAIAASRTRAFSEMVRLQGEALANELITEILALPATDPENGPSTTLGLETGESNGLARTTWDDVDDYHNLSESPPRNRAGTNLAGFASWSRQTTVERLRSSNWTRTNSTYDNVYRVRVSVSRSGRLIATAVGYKNGDSLTSSPLQGP
jgi:MSHA pilin protein MshD